MSLFSQWFQLTPLPANVMQGHYDISLVALSYAVAVLASYVALTMAGRIREEKNRRAVLYWLLGGAFTMGSGIWAMHFIGMLAFIMPMPMEYDLLWTGGSLLVAMVASGLALYILQKKNFRTVHLALGGLIIGLGIAVMHYMGMTGMNIRIHYWPGLFVASILIAIFAAEAALWLALKSNVFIIIP